jgi:hypothetical protein
MKSHDQHDVVRHSRYLSARIQKPPVSAGR